MGGVWLAVGWPGGGYSDGHDQVLLQVWHIIVVAMRALKILTLLFLTIYLEYSFILVCIEFDDFNLLL